MVAAGLQVGHTSASWHQHFTANPSEGGAPTRERFLSCHAESVCDAFSTPSSQSPKATLLMGAPGSGKSRLVENVDLGSLTVVVNPDDYKKRLPEFAGGAGAAFVHEESSWIASQVRLVAIGRSCDLLNDAVGSSAGKYANVIRQLRERSYEVRLLCVHVLDVEVLLNRVAERSYRTGRIVPEGTVREAHAAVPGVFESLRHVVDLATMMDGTANTTVYLETAGKVTVRDSDFLSKLGEVGRKLMA